MNALNASALVVNLADLGAQHKFLSVRFSVFSFVSCGLFGQNKDINLFCLRRQNTVQTICRIILPVIH